ncbi:MAG: efflux RND transporter periplasmic adaptor subunit [Candidatus Saccharibacteria bacterium]
MIKNRKYLLTAGAVILLAVALFFTFRISPNAGKRYKVKKGNLETLISCKGEVKGEKYTEINLPPEICDEELRVYQLKIADVILEGKVVKKGDYIAKIDESQLMNLMRNQMLDKEKTDADLRNAMLDSTVTLSNRRQNIKNAILDLEYQKIDLEQSKYESEAYQRKTRMTFQQAELQVDKLKRDYLLERNRLKMYVGRQQERVNRLQDQINRYQKAIAATTIRTPEDGIVMFAKDYSGKPYGKDTEINIWRPLIATLPDMSKVITETYVKEIDISKIQMNDSVRIKIDALPDKVFLGHVIKIATIGEDHKDFDMKAFKVVIRFEESNKELKPGMSSNNDIIIDKVKDQVLIPVAAIFNKQGKKIVYVESKGDIREVPITPVVENEQFVAVDKEVKEGDVILMYQPEEFKIPEEKLALKE